MLGRPIVPDRFDATFLKRARRYISLDEEAAAIEFRIRREEGPLASASCEGDRSHRLLSVARLIGLNHQEVFGFQERPQGISRIARLLLGSRRFEPVQHTVP